MIRFPTRTRLRHDPVRDRNGRRGVALRALFGSLLVFLTVGLSSVHGHEADQRAVGSLSFASAGDEAPGPLHGHTPADLIDCQICESNRRAEVDDCVLWLSLTVMAEADGHRLLVRHPTPVPSAPSCGRPSPRAPPTFSA
jgi:hypothetical protein